MKEENKRKNMIQDVIKRKKVTITMVINCDEGNT